LKWKAETNREFATLIMLLLFIALSVAHICLSVRPFRASHFLQTGNQLRH